MCKNISYTAATLLFLALGGVLLFASERLPQASPRQPPAQEDASSSAKLPPSAHLDYSSLDKALLVGRERPGTIVNETYGFSLATDGYLVANGAPDTSLNETYALNALSPTGQRLTLTVNDPEVMSSWEPEIAALWRLPAEEQAQKFWEWNQGNRDYGRNSDSPLIRRLAEDASVTSIREIELAGRRAYTFVVSAMYRGEIGAGGGPITEPLQVIFVDGPMHVLQLTLPADDSDLLEVARTLRFY